jgi:hypothetical protein
MLLRLARGARLHGGPARPCAHTCSQRVDRAWQPGSAYHTANRKLPEPRCVFTPLNVTVLVVLSVVAVVYVCVCVVVFVLVSAWLFCVLGDFFCRGGNVGCSSEEPWPTDLVTSAS